MGLDFNYSGQNLAGERLEDVLYSVQVMKEDEDMEIVVYQMNNVSESIIWSHLTTRIALKDEKSAKEFYARCVMSARINGTEVYFTLADVIRHIGLTTNVFPEMTRDKWLTDQHRIMKMVMDEAIQSAS